VLMEIRIAGAVKACRLAHDARQLSSGLPSQASQYRGTIHSARLADIELAWTPASSSTPLPLMRSMRHQRRNVTVARRKTSKK